MMLNVVCFFRMSCIGPDDASFGSSEEGEKIAAEDQGVGPAKSHSVILVLKFTEYCAKFGANLQ